MTKDPASFGIKGGNINSLKVGDNINLGKIQEIIETHKVGGQGIIERAQGLSDQAVEKIKNYEPTTGGAKTGGTVESGVDIFAAARDAQVGAGGESIVLNNVQETPDNDGIYKGAESTASGEMLSKHFDTSSESLKGVVRGPDIAAIESARNTLSIKLDIAFGEKGLFGFGATPGEKSAEWLEIKGKTIGELLKDKTPSESVLKTRNFVGELSGESGQIPRRSETIESYVKRALIETARIAAKKTITT